MSDSYRDKFREESLKRRQKQKKFMLRLLLGVIVLVILAGIAGVVILTSAPIGDVNLSPTSMADMLQSAWGQGRATSEGLLAV